MSHITQIVVYVALITIVLASILKTDLRVPLRNGASISHVSLTSYESLRTEL